MVFHLPAYHHSHHRDNVVAPHGRPKLRSRLYYRHNQEGGPRKFTRTCGGIGGIIINCNEVVTTRQWLFHMYTEYEVAY